MGHLFGKTVAELLEGRSRPSSWGAPSRTFETDEELSH